MMTSFSNIKTFIFNLDDIVWKWTELNPHVERVINTLKNRGKKIYYITSNSAATRAQIAERLTKLGIQTGESDIISAGYASAKYFEEKGINEVYLVGETGLAKELSSYGIKISEDAKHILIGTDRNFTYWKLKKIYDSAEKGATLYTTGIDRKWIVGSEKYPGALPFSTAVKVFTGKEIHLLGSPSVHMKERLLKDIFLFPEDTILIGTSIVSDIKLGNRCGFLTGLVLNGETRPEDVEKAVGEDKPTTVINDLREILRGI